MKFLNGVRLFFIMIATCCAMVVANLACAEDISFDMVEINYPHDECSFKASPVNFCDQKHIDKYNATLKDKSANFAQHYILLPIMEWKDSDEQSLVAIDEETGIVYPVPIDSFFGASDNGKGRRSRARLDFSKNSNEVCIDGSILVYRSTKTGRFCFKLVGDRFVGYHTTYMGHDNP